MIGKKAPKFSLKDQDGKTVTLPKGKVILYFYPKDDTPGCTMEACSLRDGIKNLNATVLGISMDSVESHKKFAEKYNLPFRLLADTKGDVSKKYGVYTQKSMFGKKFFGIKRTTFIIEDGKVKNVIERVNVRNHAKQILKT